MDPLILDGIISAAASRVPPGQVFVLPRADGQYSDHASDTVLLLREGGARADYASDPMEAGVHGEKAADVVLPPLLVLFSDAASLVTAIEAIVHVIRWFADRTPPRRISLDVFVQRESDGSSRREVKITGASAEEAERLLRQAAKVKPPQ